MTIGTYPMRSGPEFCAKSRAERPEIFYGDPFGEDFLQKWDLGVPGSASSLFPVQVLGIHQGVSVEHTVSLWHTHSVSVAHTQCLSVEHTQKPRGPGRRPEAADSRESLSPLDSTLPPHTHPPKIATPPLRGEQQVALLAAWSCLACLTTGRF